jgi:hypothetical protein
MAVLRVIVTKFRQDQSGFTLTGKIEQLSISLMPANGMNAAAEKKTGLRHILLAALRQLYTT